MQRLWPDVWEHPEALPRNQAVGGAGGGGGGIWSDTSQSSALYPLRHRGAVTDTNDLSHVCKMFSAHRIVSHRIVTDTNDLSHVCKMFSAHRIVSHRIVSHLIASYHILMHCITSHRDEGGRYRDGGREGVHLHSPNPA